MSIDSSEKAAVLNLIQYFQKHWIVFDVGSNKGAWSDILIEYRDGSTEAGKYMVHLFEPNKLLLDYARVKYDYNENVRFCDRAVYEWDDKQIPFYYFTNKNSGLSSIYHNEKWDYLPMKEGKVETVTLDTYASTLRIKEIDIIKIDIEGAEIDALKGCIELLRDKKVRFLQVEYSPHYQVHGVGFKSVIQFVQQFGYKVWSWDGEYFNEVTLVNFEEDYRLENFYISYMEIGRYHYTQLWNSEFKKSTQNLEKFGLALEIGCFEGLTTNHICDHLLNKDGRIICVDPLLDLYLPQADKATNDIFIGQYDRFIKNTKNQPVELLRKTSKEAFANELKQYAFDFIYIDGNHEEGQVYEDGFHSYWRLKVGGHILFDDYLWREGTKKGIDRFIEEFLQWDRIKVVIKDYQVLVQKLA